MRTSEVSASLALVEARRGNIGPSVELLTEALAIARQSRLSFHQITSAVADELRKHEGHPEVQRVLAYRDRLLAG